MQKKKCQKVKHLRVVLSSRRVKCTSVSTNGKGTIAKEETGKTKNVKKFIVIHS